MERDGRYTQDGNKLGDGHKLGKLGDVGMPGRDPVEYLATKFFILGIEEPQF